MLNPFDQSCQIPIESISISFEEQESRQIDILRLDKTHSEISGNKFFKLKYNIRRAIEQGHDTLLTFGGAYSNHIAATAAAGRIAGLKTIGIIRGEEHLPLNPTLSKAIEDGMQIHYMDRSSYREKNNEYVLNQLRSQFRDFYLIPEGGTNELAIKGTEEIHQFIPEDYDVICCSIGTGGTLAGIINAAKPHQKICGFSSLKGDFVKSMVNELLQESKDNWELVSEYHFGGYAKTKPELIRFIQDFYEQHGIPLEQIYTGKMLYGIADLLKKKNPLFRPDQKILAIHTGGLQGVSF